MVTELQVSASRLALSESLLRAAHAQAGKLGERTERMFRSVG